MKIVSLVALSLTAALCPINSAMAYELDRSLGLELLYSQPVESTNRRYNELRDERFNTANQTSQQYNVRAVKNLGNQRGFDWHMSAGMTFQNAAVSGGNNGDKVTMQHRYVGGEVGIGTTIFFLGRLRPYFEATLLLPAATNRVTIAGNAGDVTYRQDYYDDDPTGKFAGLNYGTAFGIDVLLTEAAYIKLQWDKWPPGSGKAGGSHIGVGYLL